MRFEIYADVSKKLCLQENTKHFLKVPSLFSKDSKNHKNWLNRSWGKTGFKNITNKHINRFGPP